MWIKADTYPEGFVIEIVDNTRRVTLTGSMKVNPEGVALLADLFPVETGYTRFKEIPDEQG